MSLVLGAQFAVRVAASRLKQMGRKERPVPADVAIILGAYTDGFRPSPPLLGRLKAGLHLYRQGYVSYMIVSGGKGDDETVSESSSMKRFLAINGVPPQVVFEEWRSRDTWENLRNSKAIMEKVGFQSAIIVTSDYHLPRALAVAKQLGMNVTGYANISESGEFHSAVREVLAWAKYLLYGQAGVRWTGGKRS
jgi:uncharacterized SAM-binding protein YcdF (DUF218 family)